MRKHHLPVFAAIAVSVFFLSGCESAEEKAARVKLEKLYAMDNTEIASAFDRGVQVEPFNEVRKLCENEKMEKKPGKWCEKWENVKDAWKPTIIVPKLVR